MGPLLYTEFSLETSDETFEVWFISDQDGTDVGFTLNWVCQTGPTELATQTFVQNGESGEITHYYYADNQNITWNIQSD